MSGKKLNLLADFPPVTKEAWMGKITADLKGADFNKKLVWKTNEGFNVMPFYREEDIQNFKTTETIPGKYPYVRGSKTDNDWFVRQDINEIDAVKANKKALDVLNKGVNSLGFQIDKERLNTTYIATLLNGITADCVELNFSICASQSVHLVNLLSEYFQSNKYELANLQGSVNIDPINCMLRKGKNLTKEKISNFAEAVTLAAQKLPFYRVIGVNAKTLSNAGASITQELGYALAWGNEYLSMMINNGVDKQLAAKKIKFNFGVGSNYFMEIAKFRAAKWLWALIVEAYQPVCRRDACPDTIDGVCYCAMKMRIHAETTEFNKTKYDAYVNMLRTQTEAMSASLGGVHSLTVLPFDSVFQKPEIFSERIARNQQLLLKEESHFNKVVDPASGSYYIETLTREIAHQAWKLFLDVEDEGGFYQAVKEGKVQQVVKETATNLLAQVSYRKKILLGTNQYPNSSERNANKIAEEPMKQMPQGVVEVLSPLRASEAFEALRYATETASKRPKVFLLTVGNLAMRLARAQFSANFFACAGYEIFDNLGFASVEDGMKAAQKSGADIIVLCSSDDEYCTYAPTAKALIENNQILVIAGAPSCAEELKAKGIDNFIHVKTNVLETLKEFHHKLGV